MTNRFYPAIIVELSEEDGGGYLAYAPDLVGCMGDGDTPEAALHDLQAAVITWCEEMVRLGRDIPAPGAARRAAKTREETLLKIIREQQDALDRQGRQYDQLRAEIHELREQVDRIFAEMQETAATEGDWPYAARGNRAVLSGVVEVRH
ncbi:type II toxin-antitoxin system HicB family antitoxin [Salinarimonas ramus]|uniref:HicB-like antitoxin of toxin-antitoxin system domain-containing protein n=1 Tax=Salinarimonas ramus TaxID=690164 RepID=A0A917Q5I7_9HYPH|nr:type II toxin-antitoxin system HicB family antitoxin [Salinarimonas ramus]GGK18269.1 hypothetical protein GCM10011322_01260 [Salinarimonas ramus]